MTEPQTAELFWQTQQKIGGITPDKLKPDQYVIIETSNYLYQLGICVDTNPLKYNLMSANPLIPSGQLCISIASYWVPEKVEFPNWIGLDMGMVLSFENGTQIVTKPVNGASLHGLNSKTNKHYFFDVWERHKRD